MIIEKPNLIDGGYYVDERGSISFVNNFDFSDVKRFYVITNSSKNIVRAWQGHKIEQKHFYVICGSFLICAVKVDDWYNPSQDLPVEKFTLSENKSQILMIPSGYANGIKALKPNSKLLVFSSQTLKNAKSDDYRFEASLWYSWNI
jgi:dTDP-4-dehydrorhamnose 3,5-epimerase